MLRKTVSSLIVLLLVVSTLAVVYRIQPANADGVDWWPMFHHDPNHTGTSTSTGPTTNNLLWNYTTGDMVVSSPAVVGGVVYVGSLDNNTYCLNAATGALVWNYTTGSGVYSSPAVVGGLVYVGSYDGKVYCLNAATGAYVWSYMTGKEVWSSPAVVGGLVYVGSADDNVYCLNAATGAFVWSYMTGGGVISSPAVVGGVVYVGSWDGKVYALNAATGAQIWNNTIGNYVWSSPAVVGGLVYVASLWGDVFCLNAATGASVWHYMTGGQVQSSPAVAGGVVYVGSYDHKVYALNASTGAQIWNYTTGNWVQSSPSVVGALVYVGSEDHNVYCLNAATGALVWNYTTGDWVAFSSPAVVNGVVYIGSGDGNIYAFGPSSMPTYIDVGVVSVSPSATSVTVGDSLTVTVTVQNFGTQAETFSVYAYYGNGKIGFDTKTVTLAAGDEQTLSMIWDTTEVFPNTYVIGAYTNLAGDTNPANNEFQDGTVEIVGLPYKPLNLKAVLEAPYTPAQENPLSRAALTWSPPAGTTPSTYYVFRGTSPDSVSYVAQTSVPSYNEDFPNINEVYYYSVSALFSQGQSVKSDPVALGSLEGTNGVENQVSFSGIAADVAFTVQQNIKVVRGIEGFYWIQNVMLLPSVPDAANWMAGIIQVFNFTRAEDGTYKSTNTNPLTGKALPIDSVPWTRIPYFGSRLNPFVLRATIDGTTLSVENPCLLEWNPYTSGNPYTLKVPAGSYISANVLGAGGDLLDFSPEIAVVSNPWTSLGGTLPVYFLTGSGSIKSWIRHSTSNGNQWYQCNSNTVIQDKALTEERSDHLKWDSSGSFHQDASVHDQGLWLEPDFDAPVTTVPETTPALPLAAMYISVYCPVYLNLFDSKGNICGYYSTSGVIENQIPSAICLSNDTICIINGSDAYSLLVIGTENGEYALQIFGQNENGTDNFVWNSSGTITKDAQFTVGIALDNATRYIMGFASMKTVIGRGYDLPINVTVMNLGDSAATFNVTLCSNTTVVGTETEVNLSNMSSTTITIGWNTTDVAYGNYTLSANIQPANNNLTGGTVEVTIPGDVNGDGTVNILDAIILGNAFLATPGSSNWNPNADINGDGVVNILDAIILGNHFLQHV